MHLKEITEETPLKSKFEENLKSHVVYEIYTVDLNPLISARLAIILPREQQSTRDLIFRSDSLLAFAAVCQRFLIGESLTSTATLKN